MKKLKIFESKLSDVLFEELEQYLEKFKKDATEWKDATGGIREIVKIFRTTCEEIDGASIAPLNFKELSSPSEWNTKAKEHIFDVYGKMSDKCKEKTVLKARSYFWEEE